VNILLVGSGAREHAICWKLRQSPRLTDLFIAPGNAGTHPLGVNLDVNATDIDAVVREAKDRRIDMVIVGPEAPLALGLSDRLAAEGIAAFGPTQSAARIESSKSFAKDLMERSGIPTAAARSFSNRTDARNYIQDLPNGRVVVKADGLAAGKGVFVCDTRDDALQAVEEMMGDAAVFGDAGRSVVIEERLDGREVSAMAFSDGRSIAPMPFSCDYKRAFDGDEGPNTGGVGAYSPPLRLDEAHESYIHEHITRAAVNALAAEGAPYRGVLYPGLMVTQDGPKVIEYNCRFGDPEAEVLLPRLKSDLLEICWAVVNGRLGETPIEWSTDAAVSVVISSGGYPGDYKTGYPIAGLGTVDDDVQVFHAGTRIGEDGEILTAGGRVLVVTATGPTLNQARAAVYRNVQRIHFTRAFYRRDVAAPAQTARVE
jgi:phosphoribosylamine--glycine ligase